MPRILIGTVIFFTIVGVASKCQEVQVTPFDYGWAPESCSFSRDGKLFAVGGMTAFEKGPVGGWALWDFGKVKRLQQAPMAGGAAHSLDLSPDGKLLAAGGNGGELKLFATAGAAVIHELKGHLSGVRHVRFAPDGQYLVSVAVYDDFVRVWRVKDGAPLATYRFRSKNKRRAEHDNWQSLEGVRPAEKTAVDVTYETPIEAVTQAVVSPDGRTLAIAAATSEVFLLETFTGKLVRTVRPMDIHRAVSIAFSADGSLLAIGAGPHQVDPADTGDVSVEVWDVAQNRHRASMRGHRHGVPCLVISPDNRTVISGGGRDGVRAWDAATGCQKYQIFAGSKEITILDLALLPGGKTFVAIADLQPIQFWDITTGKSVSPLAGKAPE